ncbi:MAG: homoserine kinase [Candidatus Gastranaerophilales bacterium]|nr:homoserine kinase [Candidatus Gastranaerophilales bacterium]
MKVSVKTPATIANLGCGFDSFGLALPLYNVVSVEETVLPGSGIEINIINEKNNEDISDIPTDKNNIVYKAIELLYNFIGQIPNELKITIKTQIPISRGLGSSASVIVGGLIAANELLGRPADEKVLMSIATEIEGHPDNITPAFVGGINLSSWEEDGSVIYRKLPWNDEWKLMVCVPDYELNTEISRSVLPKEVPMKDAIFNLKRSAMFVDALYNKDEELLKLSLKDKLHQPYREKLVPGLAEIMNNLKHINGVVGTVLCGAGPSILVIYNGIGVSEIKETVTNTWNYFNVKSNFLNLPIEKEGAVIL